MVRYILIRIVILVLAILALNKAYVHTFYKNDISEHADILENLWAVDRDVDAIYFGASSNCYKPEGDTVRHCISYLLDDMMPGLKVGTIENAGLHSGTFLSVIENIPEDMDLDYLFVTMNFRSFDAMWRYAQFENYLAKTERMLEPGNLEIFNKFLTSLNYYDHKTNEERDAQIQHAWRTEKFDIPGFEYHTTHSWDSAMGWGKWVKSNPELTEGKIPLAAHYIKNFAFEIDTLTNERIEDFDRIVEEADKRDIQVVFVLLGENMEEAEKLVGEELIYLMNKNRELLKDRYRKKGALMVDVMSAVPDSCFMDRNWPTEHYNTTGKLIVARAIKKVLEQK